MGSSHPFPRPKIIFGETVIGHPILTPFLNRHIVAGMIDRYWGGGDGGNEESSYGER